jgi:hypothetical protein
LAHPKSSAAVSETVVEAVSQFGAMVLPKLSRGLGQPEDQLRAPLERLLGTVAKAVHLRLVAHGEARLPNLKVRADYLITIGDVVTGYVEVKAPPKGAVPSRWSTSSHDFRQWEKLKLLPNVLYTDGNEWALYRAGRLVGKVAVMRGDIRRSGKKLAPADDELLRVLTDFLNWLPQSPATLKQLVRNVAGLCRLLREEVDDALAAERAGNTNTRFSRLAADWRQLLFPDLSDAEFADGYAQTVTFALLLARVEGISFDDRSIGEIAVLLGKSHSLMGKALSVLTEDWSLGKLKVTVDTLVRVIGAVNWGPMDKGTDDAYLHLYEQFLQEYDPELRKKTGSYYTPNDVVAFMVRFVDQILREKLRLESGLASYNLKIVDPAMGTGTFLINVIDRVAKTIAEEEGPGAVGPRLQELAQRLVGFEKQTGPYAVAELRVSEAIHRHQQTDPPAEGMRLYLSDTLANPFADERQLDEFMQPSLGPGWTYEPIAKSRRGANQVKAREPVLVVLGNPPYRDKAKGLGGWVEKGDPAASPVEPPLINAFRTAGLGRLEYVLSNLYVYFWRWATWKVFDAHPEEPTGIAAFITTAGYLQGRGFAGMRRYLRETADEGWIIDVTPERHWPPVPTRLFPGVHQPLCIAIFARYGPPNRDEPANIHYVSIGGSRQDKFARLEMLALNDREWEPCSAKWNASLIPQGTNDWESFPAISDLFPWAHPGIKPNRTWVYAPHEDTLYDRWRCLIRAPQERKRQLMKETRDRTIDTRVSQIEDLPETSPTLRDEMSLCPPPVRVGYRSFDRQWLIPDNRVVDFIRPDLWRVRSDKQVYLTEPRNEPVRGGPAITFTADPPDMHHYQGSRGGAVVPLYRDREGSVQNVAPGLLDFLGRKLDMVVSGEDLFAYTAAVSAHPGFTTRYAKELDAPGVRIPLTANSFLFQEAAHLGRRVIWLHTYGSRFSGDPEWTTGQPIQSKSRRPGVHTVIPMTEEHMPDQISYDAASETLRVGAGEIRPVAPEVWNYEVSGMQVVRKWFGYRKRRPAGRRSSDLDDLSPTKWSAITTTQLLQLLNVLSLLTDLEPVQTDILTRIASDSLITVEDLEAAAILPVTQSVQKSLLPTDRSPELFS